MSNELLDPRLPPLVRIVDDDDRVRQSEAFVLRLEGFDVREYSSAEDFLHFDDVSRAGCIVLDIRMPGMNGLELQSELLRTGRSLPILFLTGMSSLPGISNTPSGLLSVVTPLKNSKHSPPRNWKFAA